MRLAGGWCGGACGCACVRVRRLPGQPVAHPPTPPGSPCPPQVLGTLCGTALLLYLVPGLHAGDPKTAACHGPSRDLGGAGAGGGGRSWLHAAAQRKAVAALHEQGDGSAHTMDATAPPARPRGKLARSVPHFTGAAGPHSGTSPFPSHGPPPPSTDALALTTTTPFLARHPPVCVGGAADAHLCVRAVRWGLGQGANGNGRAWAKLSVKGP